MTRDTITVPCSECEGVGRFSLSCFTADPDAPESDCENCAGEGTVEDWARCELCDDPLLNGRCDCEDVSAEWVKAPERRKAA